VLTVTVSLLLHPLDSRYTPSRPFVRAGEGDGGSSCRVQSPRGSSVRFFLRFAINRLSLVPSAPETFRRSYIGNRNKRNESRKIAINIYFDYIAIELTENDIFINVFINIYIKLINIIMEDNYYYYYISSY